MTTYLDDIPWPDDRSGTKLRWWRLDCYTGEIEETDDPVGSDANFQLIGEAAFVTAKGHREASEILRLQVAGLDSSSIEYQAAKRLIAIYHEEVPANSPAERAAIDDCLDPKSGELGSLARQLVIMPEGTKRWWRFDRESGEVSRVSWSYVLQRLRLNEDSLHVQEHGRIGRAEICVHGRTARQSEEKARLKLAGIENGSIEEQAAKRLLELRHGDEEPATNTERMAIHGGGRHNTSDIGRLAQRLGLGMQKPSASKPDSNDAEMQPEDHAEQAEAMDEILQRERDRWYDETLEDLNDNEDGHSYRLS